MSTTLSNGYKNPDTGDRNWYGDINFNIQRLNDHNHNGTNSEALPITSITKSTADVLAAAWVAQGEGTFKQTITLPTNYLHSTVMPRFYINGGTYDGREALVSIRKVTSTTIDVFVNDNTLALKAVYG